MDKIIKYKTVYHTLFIIILLGFRTGFCGEKSVTPLNILPKNIQKTISIKAEYFIDSIDNELFNNVLNKKLMQKLALPNTHTLWCKMVVTNPNNTSQNLFLSVFPFSIKELAIVPNNTTIYHSPLQKIERFETPISFLPNETKEIWLKSDNLNFDRSFEIKFFSEKEYNRFSSERREIDLKLFSYVLMLLGFLIITSIFSIVQSIILKNQAYFYWAIYLLATSLAFISELNRCFDFGFLQLNKSAFFITKYTFEGQFLIHFTYLLFISSYLNLKKESPNIHKFLKLAAYLMIACFFIFQFKGIFPSFNSLFKPMIIIANIIIIIIVFLIYFSKIPHRKLIVIGSMLLILFGTFSIVYNVNRSFNTNIFWFLPFVFYSYGVLLELLFFTIALNKKTQLIHTEHKKLRERYTENLETELAERITKSKEQDMLLEEERIKNITSEFEQKIAQTEIKALRAQMNPHFIFNCLNSIEFFNANNQIEKSSEYLTKFSRLIRLVLENSRSEKITLENEFETLKLYIEMEAMRFRDKIKYQIIIDPKLDIYETQIPPLLVQPYVENAIWHGLMHKEEGGEVIIKASKLSNILIKIEIIDNGIGRARALEYKSKSAIKNKSFGMKVTAERIELINQMYKVNTKIEIIDLHDINNEPIGTKVIINIPI